MKDLSNNVLKWVGYLFGILVIGFTGVQTWSLLYEATEVMTLVDGRMIPVGDPIVASLGLVMFEGSLLYWWYFYQTKAEGLPQMGLSLLVAIFGLFLVGGATALHLGAVSGSFLGPKTPSRLITIAVIVNLIAKFLMPLVNPEEMKRAFKKAQKGRIMTQVFTKFETHVDDIAGELAEEIARDWKEGLRRELLLHQIARPELPEMAINITPSPITEPEQPKPEIMAAANDDPVEPVIVNQERDYSQVTGEELSSAIDQMTPEQKKQAVHNVLTHIGVQVAEDTRPTPPLSPQ